MNLIIPSRESIYAWDKTRERRVLLVLDYTVSTDPNINQKRQQSESAAVANKNNRSGFYLKNKNTRGESEKKSLQQQRKRDIMELTY